MRRLSSLMTLILVASVLLIGGVSAAWIYATGNPTGDSTDTNIGMGEWEFGYTVSFINNGKLLLQDDPEYKDKNPVIWASDEPFVIMSGGDGIEHVTNEVAAAAANEAVNYMNSLDDGKTYQFDYWITAGSKRVDSIAADNEQDYQLYPTFKNLYTAMFVDLNGNILEWDTYTHGNGDAVLARRASATQKMKDYFAKNPDLQSEFLDEWEVQIRNSDGSITKKSLNEYTFKDDTDITIHPTPKFNGSSLLYPVDTDGDGDPNYYEVVGIDTTTQNNSGNDNVVIPDSYNGKPIIAIADGSYSEFSDLRDIKIPTSITEIRTDAFADRQTNWIGLKFETVQIFYDGNKEQWDDIKKTSATRERSGWSYEYTNGWDTYLGEGSVVVCSDGYYKLEGSDGFSNGQKNWVWYYGEWTRGFGE